MRKISNLPSRFVTIGGRRVAVYSIGYVANVLNVSPWTLRFWERTVIGDDHGTPITVVPKPIIRLRNSKRRWYLEKELDIYKQAWDIFMPGQRPGVRRDPEFSLFLMTKIGELYKEVENGRI